MATQQEIKQREQELWTYARGISQRYHPFIDAIEHNVKADDAGWMKSYNPYLNVEGMMLAARDEHALHGAKLSILPPRFERTEGGEYDIATQWDKDKQPTEFRRVKKLGDLVVVVGIESGLHGISHGSATVDFHAERGAAKDNPVEVAETGALGRALRHMGYTFHNPWLRGEMPGQSGYENQAESVDAQELASEKMTELVNLIQQHGVSEDDAWNAISLIKFTDINEIDKEIREHKASLSEDNHTQNKISNKIFGAIVKYCMEEYSLTHAECREHLNGKPSRDLDLTEQLELIEWIKSQKQGEESEATDEVDESVNKLIKWYVDKFQVQEHAIISRMILYANGNDGSKYTTLQSVPMDALQAILKNDEVMKTIVEEAKSDSTVG